MTTPPARREIGHIRGLPLSHLAAPLFISAGAAALITFQVITSRDSIAYHYDIVYLLSRVGAVPGLSLIHNRYGLLSSWFAIPAVFNHGIAAGRIAAVANGFVLSLVLLHSWVALRRLFCGRGRVSDRFIVFALPATAFMPVLLNYTLSVSPDFFVVILTVLVLWSMFLLSGGPSAGGKNGRPGPADENLIPLFLASAAFTVKLVAAPVLPLAFLFLLVRRRFSLTSILSGTVLVLSLLLSSMTARTVVSGCPLYPAPLCFDLSWSVGVETTEKELVPILKARQVTREGGYLTPRWLRRWLGKDAMNKVGLALFALSLATLAAFPFGGGNPLRRGWFTVILFGSGTVFLLATSPQTRFAWAFLTVVPAYGLSLWTEGLRWRLPPGRGRMAASVALALLACLFVLPGWFFRTRSEKMVALASRKGTIVLDSPGGLLLPPEIPRIHFETKGAVLPAEVFDLQGNPSRDRGLYYSPLPGDGAVYRYPDLGMAGGFERRGE